MNSNQRKIVKLIEEALGKFDFQDALKEAVEDAVSEIDFDEVIERAIKQAADKIIEEVEPLVDKT